MLFGLSAAMLAVSGILFWRSRPDTSGFRRGPSPLTRDRVPLEAWRHDDRVERLLRCGIDYTFNNEDGQSIRVQSVPVGDGGDCFRDDGVTPPVLAVVLGDSFIFGHAVSLSETMVERLEASLSGDVVGLGVSSFGCTQSLRVFERCGLPLAPRLVIWVTYVNDWLDETVFNCWEDVRPRLGYQIDFPRSRGLHDAFRRFAYYLPAHDGAPAQNPPIDAPADFEGEGLRFRFDATSYAAQDVAMRAIDTGRESCEKAMSTAAEHAGKSGAAFLVVAIPSKESVYHRQAMSVLAYARMVPRNSYGSRVESYCRENGIHCLNLLPALSEHADRGEQVYFPEDGHFNARGHEIAADAIRAFIAQHGLLSTAASLPAAAP